MPKRGKGKDKGKGYGKSKGDDKGNGKGRVSYFTRSKLESLYPIWSASLTKCHRPKTTRAKAKYVPYLYSLDPH